MNGRRGSIMQAAARAAGRLAEIETLCDFSVSDIQTDALPIENLRCVARRARHDIAARCLDL